MLSKRAARIVGYCVFAVLAIEIVSFLSGFHGYICDYDKATNQNKCSAYGVVPFLFIEVFNFFNNYGIAVNTLATVAIAAFTATLWQSTKRLSEDSRKQIRVALKGVIATLKAAKAAEDSVDIAKTALRDTERAFVYLKNIDIHFERSPTTMGANGPVEGHIVNFTVTPNWANSGKTPARRIRLNFNMEAFGPELPDKFDFPDSRKPRHGVLGPNTEMLTTGIVIRGDEFYRLAQDKSTVLIWGWIDYDDVFPDTKRHRTEFCLQVAVRVEQNGTAIVGFPVYRRFNGFDDECMRKPEPYETGK
jgi:hypothetical protein